MLLKPSTPKTRVITLTTRDEDINSFLLGLLQCKGDKLPLWDGDPFPCVLAGGNLQGPLACRAESWLGISPWLSFASVGLVQAAAAAPRALPCAL